MSQALHVQIELNPIALMEEAEDSLVALIKTLNSLPYTNKTLSIKANAIEPQVISLRKIVARIGQNIKVRPWYSAGSDADAVFYRAHFTNDHVDYLFVESETLPVQVLEALPSKHILPLELLSTKKSLPELEVQEYKAPTPNKKSKKLTRLAVLTPLPPMKSGIADYSKELITALLDYYKVDIFVPDGKPVQSFWKAVNIYPIADFEKEAENYDRLLYHFGNNPMHTDMFDVLAEYGGVVVLHDFYLSGVQWYRQTYDFKPAALDLALYESHGLRSAAERERLGDQAIVTQYPCNFEVVKHASSLITHSEYSQQLLHEFYLTLPQTFQIPLMREQKSCGHDKRSAKRALGLSEDDFLVCSFGFTGQYKLNKELLTAWLNSDIARQKGAQLVFVGQNDDGPYGEELKKMVTRTDGKVRISGWTEADEYQLYLCAADIAVQLRRMSRGETSAAALDTMLFGIPTVLNANGSFAYFPDECVVKLDDDFELQALTSALNDLYKYKNKREELSENARSWIATKHSPESCAKAYYQAIEKTYSTTTTNKQQANDILSIKETFSSEELVNVAAIHAINFPARSPEKRLLLDVSVVADDDFKTGVQRVTKEISRCLINAPPKHYRVELVKLVERGGKWKYIYAREYAKSIAGIPEYVYIGPESEVLPRPGDVFVGLDLAGGYVVNAHRQGYFDMLRCFGAKVLFVVYDLIPIQFDGCYPPGFKEGHEQWLNVVADCDGAICISETVADEFKHWLREDENFPVGYFHLGADITNATSSAGLLKDAKKVLAQLEMTTNFLMVGTVEPRKGHGFVLEAMELFWKNGGEEKLVIVGKKGWLVDELAEKIESSPYYGDKLVWLQGISDEYLSEIYKCSDCLIAASEVEGFGLPLIEASMKDMPILARDIPVFREVAGDYAHYFSGEKPECLTLEVKKWLHLYSKGEHVSSSQMPCLKWNESAEEFKSTLLKLIQA